MITVYTMQDYLNDMKKEAEKKRKNAQYNRQLATAWMIYTIFGSEYHKCIFADKSQEQRLLGKYNQVPADIRTEMEESVRLILDKIVKIPKREVMACEVRVYKEEKLCCLFFKTYFGETEFLIDRNGKFTTNVYLKEGQT